MHLLLPTRRGYYSTTFPDTVNIESCPIQDEPEGEVGFQHKMSLERMAC
jgi:hypothetical protein